MSISKYVIFVQTEGEAEFAKVEAVVSDYNGKPLSLTVSFGTVAHISGVSPIKSYQPGASETLLYEEDPEIAELVNAGIWNLGELSAFLDEFDFEGQEPEEIRVGTLDNPNPDLSR